ncbi:hypothetical protein DOY81_001882, partial [Sarcophaga bullata]
MNSTINNIVIFASDIASNNNNNNNNSIVHILIVKHKQEIRLNLFSCFVFVFFLSYTFFHSIFCFIVFFSFYIR